MKIGKKNTYFIGILIFTGALVSLHFFHEGQIAYIYVSSVIGGFGVATGILIPWSILPDTIDYDELKTGKRREGDFYSIFLVLQKVCIPSPSAMIPYIFLSF